jgi:hypothetical protein
MKKLGRFTLDTEQVKDGRLTIDIAGLGTVTINNTFEGLIIDVFSPNIEDEPVHTVALLNEDFLE